MKSNQPVKIKIIATAIITLLMTGIALSANAAVYTYDNLNRLTSVTYKNGQKINYTYDPGGNMLTADSDDPDYPPTVKTTDPTDGAIDVSVSASVYVTFSETVVEDIYFNDIHIKNTVDSSVVESTYSLSGDLLTIDPINDFNYSVTYAVYIPAGSVKDGAGNALAGLYSFSFTTCEAEDTSAPTWPADASLTAAPTSADGSVFLSWPEAEDNVRVTGYNVYNGATLLTPEPITATSYNATGLTPGLYTFTVKAVDAAGNAGDPLSSGVRIRTKGDVNGDGTIDYSDVDLALEIALGSYTPSSEEFYAADVNNDNQINVLDIVQIVNLIKNRYSGYAREFDAQRNPVSNPVLNAGIVTGKPGDVIQVPLTLKSFGNVAGLSFKLKFNPGLLTFQNASLTSISGFTSDYSYITSYDPEVVTVIIYSSDAMLIPDGVQSLGTLNFIVAAGAQSGQACDLVLQDAAIGDTWGGDTNPSIKGGHFRVP